jgi:hypothetical protein
MTCVGDVFVLSHLLGADIEEALGIQDWSRHDSCILHVAVKKDIVRT